ncbi:hypothetical protein [Deinococcus radiophilus]|uniref:hypothetical protein n=1 Tax=Deinococcus radiophilus TaxID=32062 RepID=UPI00361AAD55
MPDTLTYTVRLDAPGPPRPHEALHASFYEALTRVSPELSENIHQAPVVPFALELGPQDDREIKFRVHSLQDEVTEACLPRGPGRATDAPRRGDGPWRTERCRPRSLEL